jgi:hypothetical protein
MQVEISENHIYFIISLVVSWLVLYFYQQREEDPDKKLHYTTITFVAFVIALTVYLVKEFLMKKHVDIYDTISTEPFDS